MANIGYGVTLAVSDVFPATTPSNTIGDIMNFTPPNPTRDIIDVTSSSSPNMTRESIAGLIDNGEASFEMLWDLGDAKDILLRSISVERNPRTYRASFSQYTPARTITFQAFLTGYARVRRFSDIELAALPVLARGAALRFLLTRLVDWLNVPQGDGVDLKQSG